MLDICFLSVFFSRFSYVFERTFESDSLEACTSEAKADLCLDQAAYIRDGGRRRAAVGAGAGSTVAATVSAAAAIDKERGGIDAGCVRRVHHGRDSVHKQIIAHVEEIIKECAVVRRVANCLLQTLEVLIGNLERTIHGLALGLLHCSTAQAAHGGEVHTLISTMKSTINFVIMKYTPD